MLALYILIQRYRHFPVNEFSINVDNISLMFCLGNAIDFTRYGKFIQRLLAFKFEIVRISSGKNLVSDYLTRMCDTTLFDDVESDPDQNFEILHSEIFCRFSSID